MMHGSKQLPLVSAMCITKNGRSHMLDIALTCFRQQGYPSKEIIVVHDADNADGPRLPRSTAANPHATAPRCICTHTCMCSETRRPGAINDTAAGAAVVSRHAAAASDQGIRIKAVVNSVGCAHWRWGQPTECSLLCTPLTEITAAAWRCCAWCGTAGERRRSGSCVTRRCRLRRVRS